MDLWRVEVVVNLLLMHLGYTQILAVRLLMLVALMRLLVEHVWWWPVSLLGIIVIVVDRVLCLVVLHFNLFSALF